MSKQWQEKYAQLTDYISQNPQIRLDKDVIAIPQANRAEFYELFNAVRSAFVTEGHAQMIEEAKPLCLNFIGAERDLIENLSLVKLDQPPLLRWYIDNPVDGLRRVLYDSLFDLIRGKITVDQFETAGRYNVVKLEKKLRAQGYQFWVAFAMTNLLNPDKVFTVNLDVGMSSVSLVQKATHNEKPVKEPEETFTISMVHIPADIFTVPDLIVHSKRLNSYVAIRTEPCLATWTAENATRNYEWNDLDRDMNLAEGLIIANVSDNLEDLALVRDSERFIKPDLAIICREPDNWYDQEDFGDIPFTRDMLNPGLGLYVISRAEVPQDVIDKIAYQEKLRKLSDEESAGNDAGIEIMNAGFDINKLDKLVDMLSSVVKKVAG